MNFSWLSYHYPFEETLAEKRDTILSLSASASIVLVLLQPFGFSPVAKGFYLLALLVTGTITLFINYVGFPHLFPALFNESRWTIAKALIFLTYNFLIIGLWSHICQVIFVEENIFLISSGEQLYSSLSKTVAVMFVASAFYILIRYNILTRKHLQIAQELNQVQQTSAERPTNSPESELMKLNLENKEVELAPNDLLYIRAEGNYIALQMKSQSNAPLFRTTMTQIEEALTSFPEFFRCHRSFIVNLNAIASLKGNSQGLFISVNDSTERIPVARPKIKHLRKAIANKNVG